MSVIYTPRAIRDLDEIAVYHRRVAGRKIAAAIGERIEAVIDRVARHPLSAPRVAQRRDVRVVPVLRYPYKIFYRPRGGDIEILHIRHTARSPWMGERD